MKIGKPKYEQNNKTYFAFKKDQNTFILRILPPMGKLADAGKWSLYHRVEFGHVGTDGRMKPFLSPRVVNYDKMVEVESESHTRRVSMNAKLEEAKAAGNAALTEQINNFLRKYNQDAKHYMNVVDLQGTVGLFKIGHRGFQSLKAELERLRSEGVDPVGIENGRYFVFSRSGKGRDTVYTVSEYKQKQIIEGPNGNIEADVPFPHTINEAIMGKLATDAFELEDVYPSITAEQESYLIANGPTGVDAIFAKKKEESKPANSASQQAPQQEAAPQQQVGRQQQAAPQQEAPAPAPQQEALGGNLPTETSGYSAPAEGVAQPESTTTTTEGGATVDLQTGEILNETPAASAEPAKSPEAPVSTPPAGNVAAMSDEEFFKKVESGQF